MPRFITQRDHEFIQHINRELLSDIVDVLVVLYKVIPGETKTNIYGEATEKTRYVGVTLSCLVKYNKNVVTTSKIALDTTQSAEFRFSRRLLEEANVYPETGDIIGFNDLFYEIDNSIPTQMVGSRPEFALSILCMAHLTRKSGLSIEPRQK